MSPRTQGFLFYISLTAARHPFSIPVLLDTHMTLPGGHRVRLRLPQVSDRRHVRALLERIGLQADELDVQRGLHFDPRSRVVVCATHWSGTGATLVGVAAMTYATGQVDLLVTDEQTAPGVGAALTERLLSAQARRAA